jgi:hypothetical protein
MLYPATEIIMVNIDRIMAYESGEQSEEETIAMFQELIDDGTAWTLQGHYGRTAQALIEAGICHAADVSDSLAYRRFGGI